MPSKQSLNIGSAATVATLTLFLLARPYEGTQHDGTLYFGQVLRRTFVPVLSLDSFFVGGSQDSFSICSLLLAPLYSIFSPALAHPALLMLCLLASWFAIWRLLCRWSLSPGWGLLALAVMSPLYGGLRKFGVTENFLTARSLAEPLMLASLLWLARGRLLHATLWQLAAALFHPLMAMPGLVITWMLAVRRDVRWIWLLALPVMGVGLAWGGVAPLERLIAIYDSVWWSQVSTSNLQVVLLNWTWADALTLVTDIALLAAATRLHLPAESCRLLNAIILATVALVVVHAIGTDLLRSVLVTQLQPWRVLWLTHVLSTVLAPYLLWQYWRRGGLWWLSGALLALLLMNNHAGSEYGAPLLAGWLMTVWAAKRGLSVAPIITKLSAAASVFSLLAMAILRLSLELDRIHWRPPTWPDIDIACHIIIAPVIASALAGFAARWWPRGMAWQKTALVLSMLSLATAVALWDRRDPLARAIESVPTPTPFAAYVPPDATVFWPEQLAGTWGLLQRVSHYNRQQGAGMLFNRATAELMVPRRDAYKAIRDDFEQCEVGAFFEKSPQRLASCTTPSLARLRNLCTGAVRPDYIVIEHPLPAAPLATWSIGNVTLHLHACTQFGAATAADH